MYFFLCTPLKDNIFLLGGNKKAEKRTGKTDIQKADDRNQRSKKI